jgi:uncharacterized membrane protein
LHPFDLKAAILAKHAQHVVLIHFPLALFVIGVLFDCIAQWTRKPALASAAYYNFLVAAVSSPFAVATGLLAWQWQLDGQRLHGVLMLHLIMGSVSAVLMWIVWWLHFRTARSGCALPSYRLPLELIALMIVGFTGHLGGFLSGVNVPG